MLENFLTIVDRYGHIPNGGRVYYLMRSQPPMFIPMVNCYLESTKDEEFLKKNLPIMEKEFSYWMTNHSIVVNKGGANYTLFRYNDQSQGPRPESYRLVFFFFFIDKRNLFYLLDFFFCTEILFLFLGRILSQLHYSKQNAKNRIIIRN